MGGAEATGLVWGPQKQQVWCEVHRSSDQLLSDGRWWMCSVGNGISHLAKMPTVSNGWTLWEGGIIPTFARALRRVFPLP